MKAKTLLCFLLVVIPFLSGAQTQWTGAVSTDWELAGNWSTGAVPLVSTDVIIPSVAVQMPVITSAGRCRNLFIEAGASVTAEEFSVLNISGTLTFNGTMTNTGTINFNGGTQQSFSGVTTFHNLILKTRSNIVLPADIVINNDLHLSRGMLSANNHNMHIRGNWINDIEAAAFNGGTGTVIFDGPEDQLIGKGSFHHLQINKPDSEAWAGDSVLINGNLTLTAGQFSTTAFTMVAGDLIVSAGTSVNINNALFKIAGIISNAGTIDAGSASLEFYGTMQQTLNAHTLLNNAVKDIIISNSSNNGLVLAGPLDIYGSLTYSATGKKFVTNDFLTLRSTATYTAWVGNMEGKSITGNVTVEYYIPPRKAWYFLSVPVNTSQTIRESWQEGALNAAANPVPGFGTQLSSNRVSWQADGFDAYSPGASVKKYDPATNGWTGVANTNVSGIKAADGYMIYIRGDRSVISGPVNKATVLRTKGQLYTGNQPPLTVQANKKAAVGNPYAAAIDLRKLSRTGVKNFFYVWDPRIGGTYGAGAYQVLSPDGQGNYIVVPGGGSYGPNGSIQNYIPAGLAFLAEGNSSGGSINFNENARYIPEEENTSSQLRSGMLVTLLAVNTDNSTAVADGLLVNFNPQYSNAVDHEDAVKINNSSENIAVAVAGQSLVVENRNINERKDTIHLMLSNLRVQQYRFSISTAGLGREKRMAWLIDNYTGSNTPLQQEGNMVIDFSADNNPASYAGNRFKIVFEEMVTVPVKFVSVKANNAADHTIYIDWQTADETNTSYYDLERSGNGITFTRLLSTPALGGNHALYSLNDRQPLEGINYYRIKGADNSGEYFYSKIVQVVCVDAATGMSVYPNPATGGRFSLQLHNLPEGSCITSIVNSSGQAVYSGQFNNTAGCNTVVIDTGHRISAGVYELLVTAPGGTRHTASLVIK